MDPSALRTTPVTEEEDEWDTDGFVIPSLGIEESNQSKPYDGELESSHSCGKVKKEEKIYLGPHGAPPSQSKQQELSSSSSNSKRFKQKLKEADKRIGGTGRENKLETLRELVGAGKVSVNMAKGSSRDHESQFEKRQ